MNYDNILNQYLINFTDEYCGFQYYNICKNAAIVKDEGNVVASSQNFKFEEGEFDKMKQIYSYFYSYHANLVKEDVEINLLGETYLVLYYDNDKYDLYLKKVGGGGLYSDLQSFQNIDGLMQHQNLGLVIKAVDHARKSLLEYCIDEKQKNAANESHLPYTKESSL